jgi:hypothetical protein
MVITTARKQEDPGSYLAMILCKYFALFTMHCMLCFLFEEEMEVRAHTGQKLSSSIRMRGRIVAIFGDFDHFSEIKKWQVFSTANYKIICFCMGRCT